MTRTRTTSIAVGLFIMAAVVVTAAMILATGGGLSILQHGYVVTGEFTHIGDLQTGAPVKLGGYRVGSVVAIGMRPDRTIEVDMVIEQGVDLLSDSTPAIRTSGLVGDAFIEFLPGKKKTLLPKNDSAVVTGKAFVSTDELFDQVQQIGDRVDNIMINVNKVIGNEEFQQNIRTTVENTAKVTGEAHKLLAELRATSENIQAASKDFRETSATVRAMTADIKKAVDETVTNEKNVKAIGAVVANIEEASKQAKTTSEHLASILARADTLFAEQEPRIRASVDDVQAITRDLRLKLAAIRTDKGVLRYFTTNDLNEKIDGLFRRTDSIVADVEDIVEGRTFLEILKAYVGGKQMWQKEYKEIYRLGFTSVSEIEDEHARRERAKTRRRREEKSLELDVAPGVLPDSR